MVRLAFVWQWSGNGLARRCRLRYVAMVLGLFGRGEAASAAVDFLPSDDARSWLAEGMAELAARLGAHPSATARAAVSTPRWLTTPPVEKPRDLDALFEHICMVQAEVGQRDVEFALVEPSAGPPPPGFAPLGDPQGQLMHTFARGDELAILVTPALLRVPALVHASVARELGRIAIHRVGGHHIDGHRVDAADMEAEAELAAILLGMGIWVANGAYVYENKCCGGGCGVDLRSVRAGLSLPEACFALALDGRRRGLSPRLATKHLESTQKAAFKAAVSCVAGAPQLVALASAPAAALGASAGGGSRADGQGA
jgi:hypothetical protein